MKFRLDSIEIYITVSVIIMAFTAGLFDQTYLLWSLLALFPHEIGHCWAARRMGFCVESLTLYPYGAQMQLTRLLYGKAELVVAAAGPIASVCASTFCAGLIWLIPQLDFLTPFVGASFALGVMNCLPALPMDGGRILRSTLWQIVSNKSANRVCFVVGLAMGAICCMLAAYELMSGKLNIPLFGLSAFMLIGSIKESKSTTYSVVTASVRRQTALRSRRHTKIKTIGVHCNVSTREALKYLKSATVIAVLDDDMRLMGSLGEGDLLRGMADGFGEREIKHLL